MNKKEAERLFNTIPDSHTQPLPRPVNHYTDRVLRNVIEDANRHGDCIINVGNGYYRPVSGNAADETELKRYLASELSRARKILHKRMKMKTAFSERVSHEASIGNTG